jgi:hypothetical protein
MLPNKDGFEIADEIREINENVPNSSDSKNTNRRCGKGI